MAGNIKDKILLATKAQASATFDIPLGTLEGKLTRAGISLKGTDLFPVKDFVKVIYSDYDFERTRKTKAEADLAELELKEKQGDIITLGEAKDYLNKIVVPLMSLLHSMPKSCAPKANPADVPTAELAIEEATNNICRQIQKHLQDCETTQ